MAKVLLRSPGEDAVTEVALERAEADGGERYVVTVTPPGPPDAAEPLRVVVEVERTGAHGGWLRIAGRVLPFRGVRGDDTIDVWVRGRWATFERVQRTARRASGGAPAGAAGQLTAPMPGKILQINAVAGDAFEAHAGLIVMESMKMEMTISAPAAGRVKEVRCEEGELVEMGAVLAILEPAEADGEPS